MKVDKLKIRAIRARAVAAPMKRPLHTSIAAVTVAPLVLIDLQTDGGIVGRSYLFGVSKSALAPILKLVEGMAEMVKGDAVAPFDLEKKLRARHALLGVHNIVLFAMSGIDMAAWDALGQALGQPLVRLLGGTPRPIPAYNSKGLGIMERRKLEKEARELLDEGFSAVKLRLGRASAREDLEALRAVKKAIGAGVTLMVDFNQGLTVAEALKRGRMIDEEGGVSWIEEPVRADDFAGCSRLAREIATPIQIGENFMGPEQMQQALAARACDYVMPDAQRIGGVTGWMRAAALAQGAEMEMSSHLFPEVSAHLLAVTPTCHWLEFVDWAEPVLEQPARVPASACAGTRRRSSATRFDVPAALRALAAGDPEDARGPARERLHEPGARGSAASRARGARLLRLAHSVCGARGGRPSARRLPARALRGAQGRAGPAAASKQPSVRDRLPCSAARRRGRRAGQHDESHRGAAPLCAGFRRARGDRRPGAARRSAAARAGAPRRSGVLGLSARSDGPAGAAVRQRPARSPRRSDPVGAGAACRLRARRAYRRPGRPRGHAL